MAPATPAAAQQVNIIGSWSIIWKGAKDSYAGKLDVLRSTGPGRYYGKLTLLPSKGGSITQEARILVNGTQINIECYNPNRPNYFPDRFFLTLYGSVMQGFSIDSGGQRGTSIILNKL